LSNPGKLALTRGRRGQQCRRHVEAVARSMIHVLTTMAAVAVVLAVVARLV
jgi:hypothetical protein